MLVCSYVSFDTHSLPDLRGSWAAWVPKSFRSSTSQSSLIVYSLCRAGKLWRLGGCERSTSSSAFWSKGSRIIFFGGGLCWTADTLGDRIRSATGWHWEAFKCRQLVGVWIWKGQEPGTAGIPWYPYILRCFFRFRTVKPWWMVNMVTYQPIMMVMDWWWIIQRWNSFRGIQTWTLPTTS